MSTAIPVVIDLTRDDLSSPITTRSGRTLLASSSPNYISDTDSDATTVDLYDEISDISFGGFGDDDHYYEDAQDPGFDDDWDNEAFVIEQNDMPDSDPEDLLEISWLPNSPPVDYPPVSNTLVAANHDHVTETNNKCDSAANSDNCGVCYSEKAVVPLMCSHKLCFACYFKIFLSKKLQFRSDKCCPFCRATQYDRFGFRDFISIALYIMLSSWTVNVTDHALMYMIHESMDFIHCNRPVTAVEIVKLFFFRWRTLYSVTLVKSDGTQYVACLPFNVILICLYYQHVTEVIVDYLLYALVVYSYSSTYMV